MVVEKREEGFLTYLSFSMFSHIPRRARGPSDAGKKREKGKGLSTQGLALSDASPSEHISVPENRGEGEGEKKEEGGEEEGEQLYFLHFGLLSQKIGYCQ